MGNAIVMKVPNTGGLAHFLTMEAAVVGASEACVRNVQRKLDAVVLKRD